MDIPEIYYSQAIKPRGNNMREKLSFLADWYAKSAKIEASDEHQRVFCDLMVKWSEGIQQYLNEDDDTVRAYLTLSRGSIVSGYGEYVDNPAEKAFMSYLYIELGRVLE